MKKFSVNLFIIFVFLFFCAFILSSCSSSSSTGGSESSSSRVITGDKPVSSSNATGSADEAAKAAQFRREIESFEKEMIFFDFDSSELKPEATSILDRKARWLMANPRFAVRISGHCDERGTAEYNMALGQRRSTAAYNYLKNLGVPSSQLLDPISYGEEKPLVLGSTQEAWAKNRRDEFQLIQR